MGRAACSSRISSGAARARAGYVEYSVPRASGGAELPKLAYVGGFGAADSLLAIQAGVYVDDIDAAVFRSTAWIAGGGLAGNGWPPGSSRSASGAV